MKQKHVGILYLLYFLLFLLDALFGMLGIVWAQAIADCLAVGLSFCVYRKYRPRVEELGNAPQAG